MKSSAKSAATSKALLHNQNFRKEQKYKGDSAHNILELNNKIRCNIAYPTPVERQNVYQLYKI